MSESYEILRAAVERARVVVEYHLQSTTPDAVRLLGDLADILNSRQVERVLKGDEAPSLAPDNSPELPEPTLLGDNVVPLRR